MKLILCFLLLVAPVIGHSRDLPSHDGIQITRFEFIGNTAFSSESLMEIVNEHTDATWFSEDLIDASRAITKKYVDAGYINSGAVLEGLEGDSYRIRIVEGELTALDVNSDGRLNSAYIEQAVRRNLSHPLNMKSLQWAITRLERDPRIDYVKGKLVPGENPGEANLQLDVFESNPLSFNVHANNYLPPSVGDAQLVAELNHLNLTGRGDSMFVTAAKAEGSNSGSIVYRYPRPDIGWELEFAYVYGDTLVVEEPFDQIDIESNTNVARFAAKKTLTATNRVSWSLGFVLEEKSSESFLFNEPFDFTFGSRNGKTDATVISVTSEFQLTSQKQAFVMRNEFRKGIGWLFAAKPRAEFRLLLTQVQFSRRLDNSWLFLLRSNIQLTDDSLKSFERFPLGGRSSVRGYRENQLLRDNAIEVSAEVRIPLGTLFNASPDFSLAVFTDYGRAWNTETPSSQEKYASLSSVGLGLRYRHPMGVSIQFEWAKRLKEKGKEGSELQDDGIHVGITYEF